MPNFVPRNNPSARASQQHKRLYASLQTVPGASGTDGTQECYQGLPKIIYSIAVFKFIRNLVNCASTLAVVGSNYRHGMTGHRFH